MTAPTIRRTNVLAAYRTQDGSKVWDIPICIYDNRVYLLFPSGDLWPVTEWYKFPDQPEDVKFVCYSPVSTLRPCDIWPVLEFIKTLPAPVANTPQTLRPAPEPESEPQPPKPRTHAELVAQTTQAAANALAERYRTQQNKCENPILSDEQKAFNEMMRMDRNRRKN